MSTFPLRRLHTLCRMSSNGYVPQKTLPEKFGILGSRRSRVFTRAAVREVTLRNRQHRRLPETR